MGSQIRLAEPIHVAYSEPGESRWGFHQFPALSRLPDGRILLAYADAEDASETHGLPAPAFVSPDGTEWEPFEPKETDIVPVRPHFAVTELPGGAALALPASPYFDIASEGIELPEPVAVSEVYGKLMTYRCDDLPESIREDFGTLRGFRYETGSGWREELVDYDLDARLAWRREGSSLLPRPFFERPALVSNGEVLYPDYRVRFALPDGRIAPKGATWLMASNDGGISFSKRALVAVDPSGHDLHGEPTIAETPDGALVCVVRRTDHVQKPMAISWSTNRGVSWTPLKDLFEFGVFPCLLSLECGALLLSYGRPGVHLALSSPGDGRRWNERVCLIEGDPRELSRHTCGYTSLLAVGPGQALIAYSDFLADGPDGRCKAICVRFVEIDSA